MESRKSYNRKIVSIVSDTLFSCEQRIIKKNYRTFLEALSDFGFGQHTKQQEQVDLAKQILAGMAR
jgi:hypothetical protein